MTWLGRENATLEFRAHNRSYGWDRHVEKAITILGPEVSGEEMWRKGFRLNEDDESIAFQQYLYRCFKDGRPPAKKNLETYMVWRFNSTLSQVRAKIAKQKDDAQAEVARLEMMLK